MDSLPFSDFGYKVEEFYPTGLHKETMFRGQQESDISAPVFLFSGGCMGGSQLANHRRGTIHRESSL
jgi:hypothetical protein